MSFAFPVKDEAAIREHIESLKKEYFDARHHCYAWILGADKKRFRAFDDGEPNHSAGDPILGQIRSKNLADVLIIVVRYFGGTKLGVGGLIHAYKTSAEDALSKAAIIEEIVKADFHLVYDYQATNEVMRLLNDFEAEIVDQQFADACSVQIKVPVKNETSFLDKVKLLQQLNIQLTLQSPVT